MNKGCITVSAQGTTLADITASGIYTLKCIGLCETVWDTYSGLAPCLPPPAISVSYSLDTCQMVLTLETGERISVTWPATFTDSTLSMAKKFVFTQVVPAVFPSLFP